MNMNTYTTEINIKTFAVNVKICGKPQWFCCGKINLLGTSV